MKHRTLTRLLFAGLLALPAAANDWYVDAVNGDNSNGGTSAIDAWRTITHAVANTPTFGVQTIHIAPGEYKPSTGELFPIQMRPDLQLVGQPGEVKPHLTGHGLVLIEMRSNAASPVNFGPQTLLENLVLARANGGVRLVSEFGEMSATLRGLEVFDTALFGGISVQIATVDSHVVIERSTLKPRKLEGAIGGAALQGGRLLLELRDCELEGGSGGIGAMGTVDLRLERCRITRMGYAAIRYSPSFLASPIRLSISDCDISFNDNYGMWISGTNFFPIPIDLVITGSTFADNGQAGVSVESPSPYVEVDRCIFSNPIFDLAIAASSNVSNSLISHGQFTGVNGNFVADPLFVDLAQLDSRLRWNSPCIDLIADPIVAVGFDVEGHPRGVDGDLDRIERSDIGAHEFRPLELVSTGELGSTLRLESWGPQGNASVVYWTRAAPVAPSATPFGEFELDLNLARVFRTTTVGAVTPSAIVRQIPNNPLLAGHTYAFQSLTDNAAAPLGKAYTNVVTVTFVP